MNRRATLCLLLALTFTLAAGQAVWAQGISASPSKPLGTYAVGEPVTWRVEVHGEGASSVAEVHYVLKQNGYAARREGALPLTNGVGTLEASLDQPGTLLAELKATVGGKEVHGLAGAAVAPAKIGPSLPRPKDFDQFWKAKLAELARVPVDPVLEAAESDRPGVEYFKLRMNNLRGTHIYGQLARPTRAGKFPALLIVQWAGVYPLQRVWATERAEQGWLVLNIMPHDLPFDQPEEFYRKAAATTLAHYPAIGNDDRETSYFLRMYLSCYRAADYLAHRPEWDGRTLVVMGSSQGGLQAIVTAGLYPKITAAVANVPAGCDHTGPEANRAPGWPGWYWQTDGKDAAKVRQASRYFDVVNFASRVTCPVLVGLGLVDTTCPPSGIFAMVNQLRGPTEVVTMPLVGHDGPHDALWNRADTWFDALRQGKPAPWRGQ